MLAAGQAVGGDSLDTRLAAPPAPTVVSAFLLRSHRREGVGRVGRAGSNGATALTPSYSHYLALSPSLPLPSITCIISVLNQLSTFRNWLLVKFSLSIILMHSSRVLVAVCVCLLCLCDCVCVYRFTVSFLQGRTLCFLPPLPQTSTYLHSLAIRNNLSLCLVKECFDFVGFQISQTVGRYMCK